VQRLRGAVMLLYRPVCHLCGRDITAGQAWDVDHLVPRSMGGTDALANLRPAHARCNRSRGAKPPPARAPSWPL
jgi:5-methylcytosine-specific restriction endonuclease McrA